VISQWTDPTESAGHVRWAREFWTAEEPFATGEVCVNHLDAEESTRIRAAYSHGYERLVALKNKYDPTNLFRRNQNIEPTVWASGCGAGRVGGRDSDPPPPKKSPTV
jgi:FAD/FMN-containing dehydrogenase